MSLLIDYNVHLDFMTLFRAREGNRTLWGCAGILLLTGIHFSHLNVNLLQL